MCCVILEGGPGSLENVVCALKHGTPVVVIKSSGRAANILAYAYLNSESEEIEEFDAEGQRQCRCVSKVSDSLRENVTNMLCKEFGSFGLKKALNWIEFCLNRRDLITIFDFESQNIYGQDLDVAILLSILKATKNQQVNQLKLALALNYVDVARKEIFKVDRKWNVRFLVLLSLSNK